MRRSNISEDPDKRDSSIMAIIEKYDAVEKRYNQNSDELNDWYKTCDYINPEHMAVRQALHEKSSAIWNELRGKDEEIENVKIIRRQCSKKLRFKNYNVEQPIII